MLFILPLGHQVTQEELLICPSHAAVLANYSDLMCALAGICGDARCYCINPPAPIAVFIILNRLPSLVSAVFLCRGNLTSLAQDVTRQGAFSMFACVSVGVYVSDYSRALDASTLHQRSPLLIASYAVKPQQPKLG